MQNQLHETELVQLRNHLLIEIVLSNGHLMHAYSTSELEGWLASEFIIDHLTGHLHQGNG